MKQYDYLIVVRVSIKAETRNEADKMFRDEYSDNLNQYIVQNAVEEFEEEAL